MTTDKAKTNAATKPAAGKKAEEQAQVKRLALGSADNLETQDHDAEASQEDAESNEQAGGLADQDRNVDFQIRGYLMALIIRMPARMRMIADGVKLDELVTFVLGFEDYEERIVCVELLKAIGESDPAKIASGAYKDAVQAALDVINGLAANRHEIGDHASQEAAHKRMQMVTSGLNFVPEAEAQMRKERSQVKATEEQESSLSGLYSAANNM